MSISSNATSQIFQYCDWLEFPCCSSCNSRNNRHHASCTVTMVTGNALPTSSDGDTYANTAQCIPFFCKCIFFNSCIYYKQALVRDGPEKYVNMCYTTIICFAYISWSHLFSKFYYLYYGVVNNEVPNKRGGGSLLFLSKIVQDYVKNFT